MAVSLVIVAVALLFISTAITKTTYATILLVISETTYGKQSSETSKQSAKQKLHHLTGNGTILISPNNRYNLTCQQNGTLLINNNSSHVFNIPNANNLSTQPTSYQELERLELLGRTVTATCKTNNSNEVIQFKPLLPSTSSCRPNNHNNSIKQTEPSFQCISSQGLPSPSVSCKVVHNQNEIVCSKLNVTEQANQFISTFALPNTSGIINNAAVQCTTEQILHYGHFVQGLTRAISRESNTTETKQTKSVCKLKRENSQLLLEITCVAVGCNSALGKHVHLCSATVNNRIIQLCSSVHNVTTTLEVINEFSIKYNNTRELQETVVNCTLQQQGIAAAIYTTSNVSILISDIKETGKDTFIIKTSFITAALIISLISIVVVLIAIFALARLLEGIKGKLCARKSRQQTKLTLLIDEDQTMEQLLDETDGKSTFNISKLLNEVYARKHYGRVQDVENIDQQSQPDLTRIKYIDNSYNTKRLTL